MRKLSIGSDATLGSYRQLAAAVFGENSKAVAFLDEKISTSPNRENEEVRAPESQMLYALTNLNFQEASIKWRRLYGEKEKHV